ncbi:hypothetical protein C922_05280 [Plasmodium inui San Antonio 1]|uniref:Uncharacterized protein n=1 Tax=Plasmodium inui San Antonio 1 TaxID=1237626 RepID=W7AGA0_9APIC|nr:hypothetical protein C922_05280 [Plasmodium inui San Antonio 1]EUD64341.1 hypothetical protein C922_05280 [Plasmodium inui San Antonio 1]
MAFKSGAALLSILTLHSFLIRSICCDTERSLFKRLLKVRCKNDNHEVTHKPIYVKGRQEEKKAEQEDYTQNDSDFYNELRSDLRTNLKNLFKYENTKKEHRDSGTQRKKEGKWKDKKMLKSQLRMRPKDEKRTEIRKIKYPQELSYEDIKMVNIIKPGKNNYKIVEAGRIHRALENNYETVEIGQIVEPDEEQKETEKVTDKETEKVTEKTETRAQSLNPSTSTT